MRTAPSSTNSLGHRKLSEETVDFLPLVQLPNECNELPLSVVSSGSAYSSLKKPHSSQSFRFAVSINTWRGLLPTITPPGQVLLPGFPHALLNSLLALLRQCLSPSRIVLPFVSSPHPVCSILFSVDIKCFRLVVGPHFTEHRPQATTTAQEGHHLRVRIPVENK